MATSPSMSSLLVMAVTAPRKLTSIGPAQASLAATTQSASVYVRILPSTGQRAMGLGRTGTAGALVSSTTTVREALPACPARSATEYPIVVEPTTLVSTEPVATIAPLRSPSHRSAAVAPGSTYA